MALGNNLQFAAGGNIKPSRFLKMSADHTVVQAGAGEAHLVVAISEEGSYNAPTPGADTTYLAVAGAPVPHRAPGDEAMLICDAAVSAGDLLEPDADGRGTAAASTEDACARVVQGTAAANEPAKVVLLSGTAIVP